MGRKRKLTMGNKRKLDKHVLEQEYLWAHFSDMPLNVYWPVKSVTNPDSKGKRKVYCHSDNAV